MAVVGAGPAGTTAARILAERGAEVRLFEARRLPRPKTCGGGLTLKAQRLLGRLDSIAWVAERSLTAALVTIRFSGWVREQAVDAIAGRRAPFAIDAHCDLACACELNAAGAPTILTSARATGLAAAAHCESCSSRCAA